MRVSIPQCGGLAHDGHGVVPLSDRLAVMLDRSSRIVASLPKEEQVLARFQQTPTAATNLRSAERFANTQPLRMHDRRVGNADIDGRDCRHRPKGAASHGNHDGVGIA